MRTSLSREQERVYLWLHRDDDFPGLRFPQLSRRELLFSLAFYHALRLEASLCRFCGMRWTRDDSPLCGHCLERGLHKFMNWMDEASPSRLAGLANCKSATSDALVRKAKAAASESFTHTVRETALLGGGVLGIPRRSFKGCVVDCCSIVPLLWHDAGRNNMSAQGTA